MSLLQRVRQYAARHDMWQPDTRVIAAVSGGSDSVAMLRLLHHLHDRGELRLDAVAHLNHVLRPEAATDEAFCAGLASELALPFVSTRVDVRAQARRTRQSIEVAGRVARRTFLDEVQTARGADCIALAHTADDQAETVLLRLLRGAGPRGLSAMAPSAGRRIRPVLCATRAELRSELSARGQAWREDATNDDLENPRNRIRHELLPYLERHFNPSTRRALVRAADSLRADEGLLARQAAAAAMSALQVDGLAVRLDTRIVRSLPEAIARRVVQHALVSAGGTVSADALSAVLDVVTAGSGRLDLPRLRVEHFPGFVVLVQRRVARRPEPFRLELAIPGEVQVDPTGWILEASGPVPPQPPSVSADVAQIDASAVGTLLIVRSRQPGDRVRPVGLGGTKKVQDVLVDRKVNRQARDTVPIVTDARGRIVWVAGQVVGEEFRITEGTKAVIILKLRRV